MNVTLEQLRDDDELLLEFLDFFFSFKPHPYQLTFLKSCLRHNRIAGKWCRQAGKSMIVSVYLLLVSLFKPVTSIVVAPTQSQSTELYNKVRDLANHKPNIRVLIKKSTETEMRIADARIISLPSGPYGSTIRGFTADIVVLEEAGILKDVIVNTVIIPMLASKGDAGQIIKIGTPLIRNHFFRSCFEDDNYIVINVTWHDCVKCGQYTQKFVDEQKAGLLDIEFRTEYEAEFIADAGHFFSPILLDSCKLEYEVFLYI